MAEELRAASAAKLLWLHRGCNRRAVGRQIRWLALLTAASHTGAQGGEAAQKLLRELERELRGYGPGAAAAPPEPESQTPRSMAEFEAMMKAI